MKTPFEDDGRTIADMSGVERPGLFSSRNRDVEPEAEREDRAWENQPISKKDSRMYAAGALTAGLIIAAVFILAGAIVIAIMLAVWTH